MTYCEMYTFDMDNDSDKQTGENSQKIEAIYNETIAKVKELEQEQKKIISDYIKRLEQEKIEKIKGSLLN